MTGRIGEERPRILEEIPYASVPGGGRDVSYRTVIHLENSRGTFPACVFESEEMTGGWGFVPLTTRERVIVPWNSYVKQADGTMRVDVGLREKDVPHGKIPCAFVIGNVHWEQSNEGGLSFELRTYGVEDKFSRGDGAGRSRRRRTTMMSMLTVPYLESIWV